MSMDDLYERVHLGADAREFVTSHPIGKEMRRLADEQWSEAVREFEAGDPSDAKAMTEAQTKAWRAKYFLMFIQEAIVNGEAASQQIEQEDESIID